MIAKNFMVVSLKYRYWSFIYRCYAVWLGIKHSRQIHLGSLVIYNNKKWMVSNGVCDGYWSLTGGIGHSVEAKRTECQRVRSFNEWKHAFGFMYRWWMTSWHRIYVEKNVLTNNKIGV